MDKPLDTIHPHAYKCRVKLNRSLAWPHASWTVNWSPIKSSSWTPMSKVGLLIFLIIKPLSDKRATTFPRLVICPKITAYRITEGVCQKSAASFLGHNTERRPRALD